LLTLARLLLALVFFGMLSYYQHDVLVGRHGDPLWLNIAIVLYAIALWTDYLDGYLARKWNVEGAFGRVVDPLVDKVLVIGSFIFFAGKNFTIPFDDPAEIPHNVKTITGVVPWMVVVILARELLVTSLRGESERQGVKFGAEFSGKLKMVFQSITIMVILAYVNYVARIHDPDWQWIANWGRYLRNFCIWVTLATTVISGLLYVRRAVRLYESGVTK
jgi:CDP-diacylglycerol---glycerol-3-phosphate 3-phosphatidyltransferase